MFIVVGTWPTLFRLPVYFMERGTNSDLYHMFVYLHHSNTGNKFWLAFLLTDAIIFILFIVVGTRPALSVNGTQNQHLSVNGTQTNIYLLTELRTNTYSKKISNDQ